MVLAALRLCTVSRCKQALFAKEPLFPGSFSWMHSPSSYCYFAFLFYSLLIKLIIWFYYNYQIPENIMFQKRWEKAGFRNTSANSKLVLCLTRCTQILVGLCKFLSSVTFLPQIWMQIASCCFWAVLVFPHKHAIYLCLFSRSDNLTFSRNILGSKEKM